MPYPIGGGAFLDAFERPDALIGNDWSSFNAVTLVDQPVAQSVVRTFRLAVEPSGSNRRLFTYRLVGIVNNTISLRFPLASTVNKRGLFVRATRSSNTFKCVLVLDDGRIVGYDSTAAPYTVAGTGLPAEAGFAVLIGTFTAIAAGDTISVSATDTALDVKVNNALVRSVTIPAGYLSGDGVGAYIDASAEGTLVSPVVDDFTSNTATNTGVRRNTGVLLVNIPDPAHGRRKRGPELSITGRRWGDDNAEIDADHVNMRYARERRVRVVNSIQMVVPHKGMGQTPRPVAAFPGRRIWAGIGGFLYIPSFPQLRRKETTWPDAT